MCFSVEVEKDIKNLLLKFMAERALNDEELFYQLAEKGKDLNWSKNFLNLKRKPLTCPFKLHEDDGRIYPGNFTHVMVMESGQRLFRPMRYRIRPSGSKEEIPSKFNVFNARLDSLEFRQTWKPLFLRQHGLFPFKRFFEWVEQDGKKRLISFAPENNELMWAPCLWDYWQNPTTREGFYSFALITDDPPPEVSALGHDRCPIFLKEENINSWLNPTGKSTVTIYRLLKEKQQVTYAHTWAAA